MLQSHIQPQVYAWGDNDHGQQGNGTTTVNRKPALVHGLDGYKITRVACGSSHSICWTTTDVSTPTSHEPVLFSTSRDPLGANLIGTGHAEKILRFWCQHKENAPVMFTFSTWQLRVSCRVGRDDCG